MKKIIHNHGLKIFVAGFAVGILTLMVIAFAAVKPDASTSREILLVSRDVAFYLESQPEQPNPTITLTKGQPVKLTICNEEPGKMLHCFTTGDLGAKTKGTLATGESEVLSFTPRKKGTFVYACLLHGSMVGKIVVE